MNAAADSLTGLAIWLRCRGRFFRTTGTWPEEQAKMVAAALEAEGMTVLSLPAESLQRLRQAVVLEEVCHA